MGWRQPHHKEDVQVVDEVVVWRGKVRDCKRTQGFGFLIIKTPWFGHSSGPMKEACMWTFKKPN